MTGETPQPGKKPSNEGSPWSFSDPGTSWWGTEDRPATAEAPAGRPRHHRRRGAPAAPAEASPPGATGTLLPPAPVERSGEAAEAHTAGARDAAVQLAEPPVVERHHDEGDQYRYDPLKPPSGHIAKHTATTVAADVKAPDPVVATPAVAEIPVPPATPEVQTAPAEGAEGKTPRTAPEVVAEMKAELALPTDSTAEPDVMLLPEPNARNRPTVPLEPTSPPERALPGVARQNRRAPAPYHPSEPLPPPTGSPEVDARLERLENSPFWNHDPEQLPDPVVDDRPAHAAGRRGRRSGQRKSPAAALSSLIALGLLAAFFGWVSAEPFWLAMGHGDRGYATTTQCTSSGVTQHCSGRFSAADGRFTINKVTLLGVGPGQRVPGTVTPARMVSPDSSRAYLGNTSPLLQLRWLLGFALVLLCGYAIAGVTGARRLETARARRGAVLASLAGPVLLLLGFLIGAF
ncbi:hypothetical protein GCM10010172_25460 [Paractinoplanes ferrugineus]|uniref:Uncharacterized protein n=1 Tax=Paractinoplanes ferrugineus TaxID=113564 RepID=A0A919IXM2_9ACTN|nr:hypothetical protein [Actinoplanes ferrugineus]GIE08544.1 hypothetical protein Afe05nite_03840 [Actinoplanes ferrugineus]